MLRPLFRLLIKHGVSYQEFVNLTKVVYVETAVRDFGRANAEKISQSRAAVLTGLTRKEVKRVLSGVASSAELAHTDANRLVRILHAWHMDPKFCGPYGMPLELPWVANDKPSFTDLVRAHSGDMSAREILDELIRAAAVIETERDVFKVIRRDYEPGALDPQNLERFGTVIRNFIQTAVDNLEKPAQQGKLFERIVYTDDPVDKHQVPQFDRWIKAEGQKFLEYTDNWLTRNITKDGAGTLRPEHPDAIFTGLGLYHYVQPTSEEADFRDYLLSKGFTVSDDDEDDQE